MQLEQVSWHYQLITTCSSETIRYEQHKDSDDGR